MSAPLDERAAIEVRRANDRDNTHDLGLLTLDEFAVRPVVSYLVRDLVPAESIVLVFGAPKCGKTFCIGDLAMHAAHGMHWHGHTIARPLRVVYLAGEGHHGLRVRLHAWRLHHEAELRGDIRILPKALSLPDRAGELIAALRGFQPDVIVADTLNAYFGAGDENATQDMTAFVASVRHLRDQLHASVIIIHHTGQADQTRERGNRVLRAAADVIVQVARDESGSGAIGLQVIDARDMEAWTEPLSLRLAAVDTGWADDEGHAIRSCTVAAGDAQVRLPGQAQRQSRSHTAVLTAVRALMNQAKDGVLPRAEILSHAMQSGGISRTSAYRAIQQLAPRMRWQFIEPGSLRVDGARA